MRHVSYAVRQLPQELEESLLRLTRSYDLAFAAIDLIRDTAGEFWFLELNPAGQWAWIEEHTGLPIAASLASALRQYSAPSVSTQFHAMA
jgi:glutathione synthase/RimK-type ligase-like ATP-grasp enzyme